MYSLVLNLKEKLNLWFASKGDSSVCFTMVLNDKPEYWMEVHRNGQKLFRYENYDFSEWYLMYPKPTVEELN